MSIFARVRNELGQISTSLKARNTPRLCKDQVQAIRHIKIHNLPKKPAGDRHQVWAISVVKNELDILPHVIDHLFAQGVDYVMVADNLSTDGTREYLRDLAEENPRVIFAEDNYDVHIQSEKMTYLAHRAWRAGAQWIIPFDGDEFWYAVGMSLADFLRQSEPEMGVYYANFHHTVPTVENPEDIKSSELVMDLQPSFPGKVAFRSHPYAVIIPGNHEVRRAAGRAPGLHIVHVQYRGTEQIARKVRVGAKTAERTGEDLSYFAPHWVAGSRLSNDEIREVWENISNGLPDERIQFAAAGPMARGTFLRWGSWNQDGSLNPYLEWNGKTEVGENG